MFAFGAILVLGIFLGTGCVNASQWQGTIEERDGVVYVSNPEHGLWRQERQRIRFELEQTFGVDTGPVEAVLGIIDAVDVDSDGNVYIVESSPGRLKSFRRDGSLRWSRRTAGEGPGDLVKPYGLAWDGQERLHITNQSGRRLDVWGTDGAFIEARALPVSYRPLMRVVGFIDATHLVLAGAGVVGAEVTLVVLDLDDDSTSPIEFTVNVDNEKREDGAALPTVVVVNGLIAVGDYDSYDLRFYDARGQLVRVVARPHRPLPGLATSHDGRAHMAVSWLYPPIRLLGGQLLTSAAWVDTDDPDATFTELLNGAGPLAWNSSIDLFDADGRLLASLPAERRRPEIGRPLVVDSAGKLYTLTDDPFPQVRRYRVEIDA